MALAVCRRSNGTSQTGWGKGQISLEMWKRVCRVPDFHHVVLQYLVVVMNGSAGHRSLPLLHRFRSAVICLLFPNVVRHFVQIIIILL